jgi:hypothetical protein
VSKKDRARVLREEGWTYEAIGRQLGHRPGVIWNWCNPGKESAGRRRRAQPRPVHAQPIRAGQMTEGLFPLWRVRFTGGSERIPWIYVMGPKKRVGALAGVRKVASRRLSPGRRITSIEKLTEHPIMRGDEWVDTDGGICLVQSASRESSAHKSMRQWAA